MKKNKPACSAKKKSKALSYGYHKEEANKAGEGWKKAEKVREPVAKDTNKTRRKMVKPTRKGEYA